jgi:hypothetical protein
VAVALVLDGKIELLVDAAEEAERLVEALLPERRLRPRPARAEPLKGPSWPNLTRSRTPVPSSTWPG